jgi:hypothetical protein
MDPIVVALIVLGVILVGVYSHLQNRKRKRLLRAWVRSRGLTLVEHRNDGWETVYPALKLLDRGHSQHSKLHVTGEVDGRPVCCLDYGFTTGAGKNRKVHRYSLVIVETGTPVIPLRIREEHVFDRIGEFFGHDDLDFESSEFSRRFHVSSSDRRWAYDVIHPRMMDALLKLPPRTAVEFGFAELAIIHPGALQARQAHDDLRTATRLLDLVPQDVLDQLRGDAT